LCTNDWVGEMEEEDAGEGVCVVLDLVVEFWSVWQLCDNAVVVRYLHESRGSVSSHFDTV